MRTTRERIGRSGTGRWPLALAGLALLAPAGCATNPATGETQLALIGEEQEIQMGREAAAQVEAQMGLVDDPELQRYVSRVGQGLAAASERPDLPWRFQVVDEASVNAFALPGGFIFVTRGIMAAFMSEAELAAVLGHEIGHVTARHSVEQLSQQQLFGGLAGLGAVIFDLGSVAQGVLGTGLQLLFLQYSRDDERQADDLGLRYMVREGFAPEEMLDVFRTLERVGEASGGGGTPGWLATHPAPEDRFERISRAIQSDTIRLADPIVRRDEYLRMVDGLVYGPDPRNGFFRDGEFLHPDLRFRLQFPGDWETRNLAHVVLAGSPGQDAVIQLTLAAEASAEAALRELASQQGVRVGSGSRTSVNGFPATIAGFEAESRDGPIRGLAAFIEYGGNVYRILGYAAASRYSSYEATFERTIGSFDRLTDRSALAVEPRRIDVVRVDGRIDLPGFASRYGTSADLQTLSIINGVPEGGMLDPGNWKRVVGETPRVGG